MPTLFVVTKANTRTTPIGPCLHDYVFFTWDFETIYLVLFLILDDVSWNVFEHIVKCHVIIDLNPMGNDVTTRKGICETYYQFTYSYKSQLS